MVNKSKKVKIGDIKEVNGHQYICKGLSTAGNPIWRKNELIEKAHNVGDAHPSKPWVWTEYKPGKFDWRPAKSGQAQKTVTESETGKTQQQAPQKKLEDMTPNELVDYAKNASTDALVKVVNDIKQDKSLRQIAFNQLKTRDDYDKTKVNSSDLSGGYSAKPKPKIQYKTKKPEVEIPDVEDWEAPDKSGQRKVQSVSLYRKLYAKRTDDELLSTLNNKNARWQMRQIAYDEAAARGIPEDKIDVSGTLELRWKKEKENKNLEAGSNKEFNEEEAIPLSYDWHGFDHAKIMAEQFDGGEDPAWLDPNSEKVRKIFNMENLSGRQLYDTFKDYYQRDPNLVPGYLNAQNKVNDLNGRMLHWAKADKAPMFVSAGGAGAGKTYGWQEIVSKYLSLPQLDAERGDPNSKDWGYVMLEDKDCEYDVALRRTLAKYNGSWTDDNGRERPHILFFDDADKMLTSRSATMRNLLKRICDGNPKNRIFENPDNGKKEVWRGKIIVTTNKDLAKLASNPDFQAIQSRIASSDIQFTRNETMELLADRYMDMRLNDTCLNTFEEDGFTEEEQELFRQDVFDYMLDNLQKADPRKFTPRAFLNLCDYIAPMWKKGSSAIKTGTGTMGTDIHWRKLALSLLKAELNDIEKASDYDEEMYGREAMLKRKEELEKWMEEAKKDGSYEKLYGKKAQDAILFGKVSSEDDDESEKDGKKKSEKDGKKKSKKQQSEDTKKGFDNEMSLDEAESILFG